MKSKIFASLLTVSLMSSVAMGEAAVDPATTAGAGNHGGTTATASNTAKPKAKLTEADVLSAIDACTKERPGTGGGLDQSIRRAFSR